jgi:hypothetical protein
MQPHDSTVRDATATLTASACFTATLTASACFMTHGNGFAADAYFPY